MSAKRYSAAYGLTLDQIMAQLHQQALVVECGGCLVWQGSVSTTAGSGKVGSPKWRGTSLRRLLWEKRTRKTLARGRLVTVACETPLCVEHLRTTDKAGTALRGYASADVRAKRTLINRRTARSMPWCKLSEEKAAYIRASDASGKALAAELGVHPTLVFKVRQGVAWPVIQPGGLFSGLLMRGAVA
jgi:hypothetical protein